MNILFFVYIKIFQTLVSPENATEIISEWQSKFGKYGKKKIYLFLVQDFLFFYRNFKTVVRNVKNYQYSLLIF